MRIRRKFLQLTNYTYPYGTEAFLKSYLPDGIKTDKFGNYYIVVGENPSTMFTCHLDTACVKQEKVKHVQDNKFIKTDGKTILGADDKAGMVVILYMIEKKVPGLYYFFLGEEVGCIGSGKVAEEWHDSEFYDIIQKVVSFDRRGTTSVITHQWYGRCCSDEFALELSMRLNLAGEDLKLEPDDTGVLTDSAKFMDIVPECTNISVGYYNEHTRNEVQDITYLQKLCKSVCKIDWETLPVERDPLLDEDEEFDFPTDDVDESDNEFTTEYFSYFKSGDSTKKYYICKSKIKEEESILYKWIYTQGYTDAKRIIWNGNTLNVQSVSDKIEFVGNRWDLCQFIPELSQIPTKYLKDKISTKKNILL